MIRLAKLMATVMTKGGDLRNLLRRVMAPRLHLVPGVKKRILDSETPALHRSDFVERRCLQRTLAGRLCLNAVLDDGRRFDDVAAGGVVVSSIAPSAAQRAAVERRGVPSTTRVAWSRATTSRTSRSRCPTTTRAPAVAASRATTSLAGESGQPDSAAARGRATRLLQLHARGSQRRQGGGHGVRGRREDRVVKVSIPVPCLR